MLRFSPLICCLPPFADSSLLADDFDADATTPLDCLLFHDAIICYAIDADAAFSLPAALRLLFDYCQFRFSPLPFSFSPPSR